MATAPASLVRVLFCASQPTAAGTWGRSGSVPRGRVVSGSLPGLIAAALGQAPQRPTTSWASSVRPSGWARRRTPRCARPRRAGDHRWSLLTGGGPRQPNNGAQGPCLPRTPLQISPGNCRSGCPPHPQDLVRRNRSVATPPTAPSTSGPAARRPPPRAGGRRSGDLGAAGSAGQDRRHLAAVDLVCNSVRAWAPSPRPAWAAQGFGGAPAPLTPSRSSRSRPAPEPASPTPGRARWRTSWASSRR